MPTPLEIGTIGGGATGQPSGSVYSKTESDARYAAAGDVRTDADLESAGFVKHALQLTASSYNISSGRGVDAATRANNLLALQQALDDAGNQGRRLVLDVGPVEVDGTLLLRHDGLQVEGTRFNKENDNPTTIYQTSSTADLFQVEVEPGGRPSTHNIVLSDFTAYAPAGSTGVGINFDLGGDGTLFSDFNHLQRISLYNFGTGLRLRRFSNSTLHLVNTELVETGTAIGSNCNAVNFIGCQFQLRETSQSSCFLGIGSALVSVRGCEFGHGGSLISFEPGAQAGVFNFEVGTFERQRRTSVVSQNNTVRLERFRFLPGSDTDVVPIRYEAGSQGAIIDDLTSGFDPGIPVAQVTLSSLIERKNFNLAVAATPALVEVHANNLFNSVQLAYGQMAGKGRADNGGLATSAAWRGLTQYTFARDALGVNGSDNVSILLKRNGAMKNVSVVNDELTATIGITSAVTMVGNKNYRSLGANQVVFTMPTSPAVDDTIQIVGSGTQAWKVDKGSANRIESAIGQTSGAGTITAGSPFDCMTLKCVSTGGGGVWRITNYLGTPTFA